MVKDKLAALSKVALLPWLQIYHGNKENRRASSDSLTDVYTSDSLTDVYTVTLMASITCWLYKNYVGKVSTFSLTDALLESLSDKYKSKVVCSEDNPNFIAGRRGHGGVAIFWKQTLDDFVSPLDIVSDRIVGI